MRSNLSRRRALQAVGAAAMASSLAESAPVKDLDVDRPGLPKICLEMGTGGLAAGRLDDAGMRRVRQLGVTHALTGGPRIPWQEDQLQSMVDKLKAGGITLGNLMIGGFPNATYGRPGRDEEIEKVNQSIRAAGKVGIPVVEYNFYAHRAMEGYYEDIDTERSGAGWTSFDYAKMKDLPPLANEGSHSIDEMWPTSPIF